MSHNRGSPGGRSEGNTSANSVRIAANSGRGWCAGDEEACIIVKTKTISSSRIVASNGFLHNISSGDGGTGGRVIVDCRVVGGAGLRVKVRFLNLKV